MFKKIKQFLCRHRYTHIEVYAVSKKYPADITPTSEHEYCIKCEKSLYQGAPR